MFTDWTEALEAEALPLDPNPQQQLAAAARVTARSSHDKDDMALLLDVLGLPTDESTLTALLPLIPEPGDAPTMTNTPAAPALSAHEAMAISMHNNGDTEQAIREATGLSETELSDLLANQVRYALHGRIPYDETASLQRLCEVHRVSPAQRELFLAWFLPLCSLHIRAGITAAQLPALLKFWRRAHPARPDTPGSDALAELRRRIAAGDMRWVMDVTTLSRAIPENPPTHGFTEEPEGAT